MSKQTEALRLALEALGYFEKAGLATLKTIDAITAIREALAEAQQQEPVAWRNAALRVGEDLCSVGPFGYYDMTAEQWLDWALSVVTVHAPPASKPWVGLSTSDLDEIDAPIRERGSATIAEIYRAIEAKLREKNT